MDNETQSKTINDFTIAYLANDTFSADVETGCGGILPGGTRVRRVGLAHGREYYYVQDSSGWGLEYASANAKFSREPRSS